MRTKRARRPGASRLLLIAIDVPSGMSDAGATVYACDGGTINAEIAEDGTVYGRGESR